MTAGSLSSLRVGVFVAVIMSATLSPSMAQQTPAGKAAVEADWAKQDAARLSAMKGLGELGARGQWDVNVPRSAAPKLDAPLSDLSWKAAAVVWDANPTSIPAFRACHDGARVYIGINMPTEMEATFRAAANPPNARPGMPLVRFGRFEVKFAADGSAAVTIGGAAAPAGRAHVRREGKNTTVALALPITEPNQPVNETMYCWYRGARLLYATPWRAKSDSAAAGFGNNRLAIDMGGSAAAFDPPLQLEVRYLAAIRNGLIQQTLLTKTMKKLDDRDLEVTFAAPHEGAGAVVVVGRQGNGQARIIPVALWYAPPLQETLDRAAKLAADLKLPAPPALAELQSKAAELRKQELASGPQSEARAELCRQARWLARGLAFANPLVKFERLLFLKRFTQETYPDVCLNHLPWVSKPGGDICVLSPVAPDGQAKPLLGGALGPGFVHGMDLWYDADRIVFGYARSKTAEPPTGWLDRRNTYQIRLSHEATHIYEIGTDGKGLRQLTKGDWSDLDPTYLPSGEIAFASERCQYSLQCNEYDKDETSCNLYIMKGDGAGIRRLTVTKDGDYLPHVFDDGTIGYTRWEYQERGWANIQSIWYVRPDGTGADALFKQHLNDPWALEDTRSIPGTKKYVSIATGHHTLAEGPIVVIDPSRGINNPQGIGIVTPGVRPPEGGMSGQTVPEGGVFDGGGTYMHPWPLSEKYFLASYAYQGSQRDLGFGLYLVDVFGTKELIYRDEKISCFTPIPLVKRPKPPVLADTTDPKKDHAVCIVGNVGVGSEGVGPKARYIRIAQGVGWPYDHKHGGFRYEPDAKGQPNWTPTRILGTVPIEADGSACFTVPVDQAVYFQLLDENMMDLRRMRSFISFQPGENRSCVGCHETRATIPPHAPLPMALKRKPSAPVPPPWGSERPVSFLADVQPVLDRNCTRCHGGLKPAGGLDFSGGLTARHNRAYDTINDNGLVVRSPSGDDAKITQPLAYGSHVSKLVAAIKGGHAARVKLTEEDRIRLVTWVDANAPYHHAFINKRPDKPPYDLAADAALLAKITEVNSRRCGACHNAQEISRLDWIDLRKPEASLFLRAPLTGSGSKCKGAYKDASDSDYQALLKAVKEAVDKAWQSPRRDMTALAR